MRVFNERCRQRGMTPHLPQRDTFRNKLRSLQHQIAG